MPTGIYKRNPEMKTGKYIRREEDNRRISETLKRKRIMPPLQLGYKHTQESKEKIRQAGIGRNCGKKAWNWNGGGAEYRRNHAPRKKPDQCEVCGAFGRICLDHNHKTGEFRGWLCHRCNVVLGFVRDNADTLINLSDYLKK